MRRKILIAVIFMLGVSLVLFFGCSKKPAEKQAPAPQKAPAVESPVADVPAVAPAAKEESAGQPDVPKYAKTRTNRNLSRIVPFFQNTKDMEKYDSSEESCRQFCKKWCPMAGDCSVPVMKKPQACKRLCYDPCTKGHLPKMLGDCLMNAGGCPQVKECFKQLRQTVTEKKDGTEPKSGETAPAEKPSPTDEQKS